MCFIKEDDEIGIEQAKSHKSIGEPHRFETRFRSPQLDLWQKGEVDWYLVKRLPDYAPRQRKKAVGEAAQRSLDL
jgi:hypothetical protein